MLVSGHRKLFIVKLLSTSLWMVFAHYPLKKVMKLIQTLKSSRNLKSQSDEFPSGDHGRPVPPPALRPEEYLQMKVEATCQRLSQT